MTKILLVRHAETDAVGKTLSGRTPGVSLNAHGSEQARELAKRITGLPIAAIYASPLERTQETAAALADLLGIEYRIEEHLNELNYGEWTGRPINSLKDDRQFQLFNTFRSATRIPGGELFAEAQLRIVTGIEKIRVAHKDQAIIVVSHSDMIKSVIAYYAGIQIDMLQRLEISPASVSIIELYDETARIVLLNHTGEITL